jgi:hypothetical protein
VDGVAPDRDSLEPEEARVEDGPQAGHSDPDPDQGEDLALGEDTGEDEESDGGSDSPPATKLESWRKRSATGAVLTGLALGFQQVFEKEREEPAIIMTTSGDPPRDLPVEAEVEHGRPRRSVVNIRPWLLDRSASQPGPEETTGATGTDTGPDQPAAGSQAEGD